MKTEPVRDRASGRGIINCETWGGQTLRTENTAGETRRSYLIPLAIQISMSVQVIE